MRRFGISNFDKHNNLKSKVKTERDSAKGKDKVLELGDEKRFELGPKWMSPFKHFSSRSSENYKWNGKGEKPPWS